VTPSVAVLILRVLLMTHDGWCAWLAHVYRPFNWNRTYLGFSKGTDAKPLPATKVLLG
jgi:hypothetical protein